LVVGCLVVASLVVAETPPCTQVTHSGVLILRMRVGLGDLTPQERVVAVQHQLVDAMSVLLAAKRNLDPADVTVRYAGEGRTYRHEVWFRDIRIVGVTQADADANGCCTQQLAARWAANLRRALYLAMHDC